HPGRSATRGYRLRAVRGAEARGQLDTGPDADGARCPGRSRARARGRGGRLSHETVRVSGARGAPQGAGAPPARPISGSLPDWRPRGRPRDASGASPRPADYAQREGVRLVGTVRAEPGAGARPLDHHHARVGRQPRPVRQCARGAGRAVAAQDRRRLRDQADHHAARRRVPVRYVKHPTLNPLARLRLQLTAWYAGVFTLVLALLGTGLFLTIRHQMSRHVDRSLSAAAVVADRMELEDEYTSLIETFAAAALAALLLVAGGGYLLIRKSSAPVERSMDQMRRFMADAAHELRTPITILRTRAEVALAQE